MLINLSNHPSEKWSDLQLRAASEQFCKVVDLPFPDISPDGDELYIEEIANDYFDKIESLSSKYGCKPTIHLMGEMNFTCNLLVKLINAGYECVASTTRRETIERADGIRESTFRFVRFRKYMI
jgi:hypothetical protein